MFGYGYGGLEFVVLPLALVGIVLLGIVALAGGRADPDPHGHRPRAMYLSLVSFVAVFTLLVGIGTTASALANAIFVDLGDTPDNCVEGPYGIECEGGSGVVQYSNAFGPGSDADRTRDALNGVAVGAAAAGVLLLHRKRTRSLTGDPTFGASPGGRTYNAYLYAVSFVAMIVLLATAGTSLFALVRVVAPGAVTDGPSGFERDAALVQLVTSLVIGGAATFIYATHWRGTEGARREAAPEPAP